MLLLAYVAPLWSALMDARGLARFAGDLRRTHLHPPRRAALWARYGATTP
jgi:alkane 1-monooxygenase